MGPGSKRNKTDKTVKLIPFLTALWMGGTQKHHKEMEADICKTRCDCSWR